jgi:flagellar hook-associated protein 3 FlgL
MRISTSSLYDSGVARITDLQSSLARIQQQLATGQRALTPADDPAAAAQALDVKQSLALNHQLASNRASGRAVLNQVEGALSSASDIVENAKALVVRAGNASLDDQQRGFIAIELRGALDDLLALANAMDGAGNYLFAGYQTGTQPYVRTATGALYNGDDGERMIQVQPAQQLAVSATGRAVFEGGGQDMFRTLSDVISVLETPVGSPAASAALTAGLANANGKLDKALDNVLTVRASVGSRLKQLDALDSAGGALAEQYRETLGVLEDVDYAQAISELSKQQLTLEAAQQSFLRLTSLSLFNYLS